MKPNILYLGSLTFLTANDTEKVSAAKVPQPRKITLFCVF